MNEDFLHKKINDRKEQSAYRQLRLTNGAIDFCSNDYLGIVKNNLLQSHSTAYASGSTGSRLLTGNYALIEETEAAIASFHNAKSALIFNSGYDANTGLLSAVPQRGDTVLYDYLSHASIRDGIRLGLAQSFSFLHNEIDDLEKKLKTAKGNVFVVTESVFSMDGDMAPLKEMAELCQRYGAHLIVDEAHATGVIGNSGEGLVQLLGLEEQCFARVHTFGKAVGCHGAVVLGSNLLRDYLINFCRPFIYTTALPSASVSAIADAYIIFPKMNEERKHLQMLIALFQSTDLAYEKLISTTSIQSVIVPGNIAVKEAAATCVKNNFDVRPILYPTVPKEKERLRIVLHSFNTEVQLKELMDVLS
ncbi:MAG: 8-amino-7-oxononanoate synthase [Chitinophagaceae bacterium]